jgi:hypothetical protein
MRARFASFSADQVPVAVAAGRQKTGGGVLTFMSGGCRCGIPAVCAQAGQSVRKRVGHQS